MSTKKSLKSQQPRAQIKPIFSTELEEQRGCYDVTVGRRESGGQPRHAHAAPVLPDAQPTGSQSGSGQHVLQQHQRTRVQLHSGI